MKAARAVIRGLPAFFPKHASAEEYGGFLRRHMPNEESQKYTLAKRDQFVRRYPDLREWFRAPLTERVGSLHGESRPNVTNPTSYWARPYLYFLALRGYAQLDWDWLIATHRLEIWPLFAPCGLHMDIGRLLDEAVKLGYGPHAPIGLKWPVGRIVLHTSVQNIEGITDSHCRELLDALRLFGARPDVSLFFGSVEHYRRRAVDFGTKVHCLHVVLFHRGQAITEPHVPQPLLHPHRDLPPRISGVIKRYISQRSLTGRPATIESLRVSLRHFAEWLTEKYPTVRSLAETTREQVLEFSGFLSEMVNERTGQPWSAHTKRGNLCRLRVFFRDVENWGWQDVPKRPLLGIGDIPRMPECVPRYIPEDELNRVMAAVRALECPYQRTALLIARWSGARRREIRHLPIDCLDRYPDGTARLRIPAGKLRRERVVPLNEEAADAIRRLQADRTQERAFQDSYTGSANRYLFLRYGKPISAGYLFDKPLKAACAAAGLVTPDGRPLVSAHRFRHTVGTQLAERGAKLRTIMNVLGHITPQMSMRYAQISDREVLRDYQSVLGPGATVAGPFAETLRAGSLLASDIDWLKSNFFKTELELGHCLRLPHEGPCECDLYLNCAKFVTTPGYAPRLRRRRKHELTLVEDAKSRGWEKEVERHRCTIRRIEQLLLELGEPVEGKEAMD